jgi:hypothetical protein
MILEVDETFFFGTKSENEMLQTPRFNNGKNSCGNTNKPFLMDKKVVNGF